MKIIEKEQSLFTSDDIGMECPKGKKWRTMEEVKHGRFCDGCHEKLFYVGGYTKREVIELQRKYGTNICVGVRKRLATAGFKLSFSTSLDKLLKNVKHDNIELPVVVGIPAFDE